MFTANMLKIKQNELIISEMFHQDVLWNKKHKKYRNKSYTTKAWTTVATKIGMNGKYAIYYILIPTLNNFNKIKDIFIKLNFKTLIIMNINVN